MAYSKRKSTSRTRKSSTRRPARNYKRSTTVKRKRGTASRRTNSQTLRIVIEQPQALSSVPANQNTPRKAMF